MSFKGLSTLSIILFETVVQIKTIDILFRAFVKGLFLDIKQINKTNSYDESTSICDCAWGTLNMQNWGNLIFNKCCNFELNIWNI